MEQSKPSAFPSHQSPPFRDSKRRILQNVLVKIGKAEKTDDSEYQRLKNRHRDISNHLQTTTTNITTYMESMKDLGNAASLIGKDSVRMKPLCKQLEIPTYKKPETIFSKLMSQVQEVSRDIVENEMKSILSSLQTKIDDLNEIKKLMNRREQLKIDYDSAVRKLRVVKENGLTADISRRELKLTSAEEALNTATSSIIQRMGHYEAIRSTLIDGEIEKFQQAQAQFFTFCNVAFRAENTSIRKRSNNLDEDGINDPEISSPRGNEPH